MISEDAAQRALEHLCDPKCPPEDYWPTPYMDLPEFIKGAGRALKLCPPRPVYDRLVEGVSRAAKMLQSVL